MMFEAVNATSDGKCPQGFAPHNPIVKAFTQRINSVTLYVECLKIKVRGFMFAATNSYLCLELGIA